MTTSAQIQELKTGLARLSGLVDVLERKLERRKKPVTQDEKIARVLENRKKAFK